MLSHIQNETMRPRVTLSSNKDEHVELPWTAVERLIDEHHASVLFKEHVGQPSSSLISRWLQYGCLIAVFIIGVSFRSISRSQEASYLKKFDSDNFGEHKWNVQNRVVQSYTMSLKHRNKTEAP